MAVITISEFADSRYAKNALLLNLGNRRKLIKYITTNDKTIPQIVSPYWISGNKFTKTYFYKVPDTASIINDYLSLHPPTISIQDSDFNSQEIIKIQVERSHDIIKDAEPMRLVPMRVVNRPEAYIGMVAQCVAEYQVRCWTGMYEGEYVDCPITLMVEDFSRNSAWKKFREDSMARPIIEKNVNYDSSAGGTNCRFQHGEIKPGDDTRVKEDLRWLILDELKMSPKELAPLLLVADKLPGGIMPEMFE